MLLTHLRKFDPGAGNIPSRSSVYVLGINLPERRKSDQFLPHEGLCSTGRHIEFLFFLQKTQEIGKDAKLDGFAFYPLKDGNELHQNFISGISYYNDLLITF